MIKLNNKSLMLLKKCLEIHKPDLLKLIETQSDDIYTEQFYNMLRDAVCDELLINGLIGDTPTKYGIELENLIDEIGRLFM